jgi:hypothetical protein
MSQKKRVRIYKAGGQQGQYINPTAKWMMQMGGQGQGQDEQIQQLIMMYAQIAGVTPEEIIAQLQQAPPEQQQQMMEQMMQAVQQAQGQQQMMQMGGSPEMMDPNMMQEPSQEMMGGDPMDELIQMIIMYRQEGMELDEIANMILDQQPEIDEAMLQQALQKVAMAEEQQGIGPQPEPEDQGFSEEDLMQKGGVKKLRKKFVKEFMQQGGMSQGAKDSDVSEDKGFGIVDKISTINQEANMRDQAETLAKFVYPDGGSITKYNPGGETDNSLTKEELELAKQFGINDPSFSPSETRKQIKQMQRDAYIDNLMLNQNNSGVSHSARSGYDPSMGYGRNMYTTGPNTPGYGHGMFDPGGQGYPMFYNTNPWQGNYRNTRFPVMGSAANIFGRTPDTWRTSSNYNQETLKKFFGEDFTFDKLKDYNFEREVLASDKARGLRRLTGKSGDPTHIRWSFTDKALGTQPEKVIDDKDLTDSYKPSSFGERLMLSNNRLLSKIGSKMTPIGDYNIETQTPQQSANNQESLTTTSQVSPVIDKRGPVVEPSSSVEPERGSWEGRENFMKDIVESELKSDEKTSEINTLNKEKKLVDASKENSVKNEVIKGLPLKKYLPNNKIYTKDDLKLKDHFHFTDFDQLKNINPKEFGFDLPQLPGQHITYQAGQGPYGIPEHLAGVNYYMRNLWPGGTWDPTNDLENPAIEIEPERIEKLRGVNAGSLKSLGFEGFDDFVNKFQEYQRKRGEWLKNNSENQELLRNFYTSSNDRYQEYDKETRRRVYPEVEGSRAPEDRVAMNKELELFLNMYSKPGPGGTRNPYYMGEPYARVYNRDTGRGENKKYDLESLLNRNYLTGGETPLYGSDPYEEEDRAILNAGRRNDYGQLTIPDDTQLPTMQTQQGFDDYFSPQESINRAADMIGTGQGTAELMPDDMSRIEVDQKKEKGKSYLDPSAAYNTFVGGVRALDMAAGNQRNNALLYSNTANQFINTGRQHGAFADINSGGFADTESFSSSRGNEYNFMEYGKRGGIMNKKPKYKAGGTYLLEEDVINKIKQAGGIIKFLD